MLREILNEQISLQDGTNSRKVSKREAIARRLVIGALKGDPRDLQALFKLAEQTGEFESDGGKGPLTIQWVTTYEAKEEPCRELPAISQINRE